MRHRKPSRWTRKPRSSRQETNRRQGRWRRLLGLLGGLLITSLLTAATSYALLMATATGTAEVVGSGTLTLALTDNGIGFSAGVSNMLPTDTVTRYVEVTNSGAVDGRDLALAILPSADNKLVNDATKGLQMAVRACPVTWTAATGVCPGGGVTTVLATAAVSTMRTTGTAQTLMASFTAGTTAHLELVLSLPDQTESTVNGVAPVGTIQGLSNSLTFTFTLTQRTGRNTGG